MRAPTTTKKELIQRISDQTGQPKVLIRDILQLFLEEIEEELVQGRRIEFREFGVFEVRERASRYAQNPRTLVRVEVPGKRVVKFKAGRRLRKRVGDVVEQPPAAQQPQPEPEPEPAKPPVRKRNSPF